MTVTIEKKELIIRMPIEEPAPSKSGKSNIIASTGGFNKTTAVLNGKPVSVSVNAIIPIK